MTFSQQASAIVAGACALIAWWCWYRARLHAIQTERVMERMRSDRAFVMWARWTFVSITDEEGQLFYRSLYDLRDQPSDLVWTAPRSTIIFQAGHDPDPDDHDQDEEETPGGEPR